MKKLKALCRENKAPLLLLVVADLGTLLLYFLAQHFENAGAYFLAFGTPNVPAPHLRSPLIPGMIFRCA